MPAAQPLKAIEEEPPAAPDIRVGATFDFSEWEPEADESPRPAQIEIRDAEGPMGIRPLSKSTPLTFGRHVTNDVVIDEDNVSTLHCRISWNGSGFEVTSANKGGIDVNGTLVQSRVLCENDLIRIGSFDAVFTPERLPNASAPTSDSRKERSPVSILNADSQRGVREAPAKGQEVKDEFVGSPPTSELTLAEVLDDEEVLEDDLEVSDDNDTDEDARREKGEQADSSARARLRSAKRFGEENVLRSRIVLALGGTGFVLVLASLVFWFLVNREKAQREFDAAKEELQQGQFVSGIKRMQDFLDHHPG
ncbi:MAG TPA: FHA domain-containing protein, partial [Planctomycetaceae bacterium]|nr:FHA domain-containing protein [Planctomycetaceae bacterium]